jgi:mannose-6-phosphate isomerase-like protein (cupin superfamily)
MKKEYTIRSWGKWRVVEEWPRVKVKEVIVDSHSALSYQKHEHRLEFWVVQSGSGTFVKGDRHYLVKTGNTMLIMKNEWHQIINGNTEPLVVIEIQFGKECIEEDIERK